MRLKYGSAESEWFVEFRRRIRFGTEEEKACSGDIGCCIS
jgi:hypothetical protein